MLCRAMAVGGGSEYVRSELRSIVIVVIVVIIIVLPLLLLFFQIEQQIISECDDSRQNRTAKIKQKQKQFL